MRYIHTGTALILEPGDYYNKPAIHGIVDDDPFYHVIWSDWDQVNNFIKDLQELATLTFGPETEENKDG